ncbi:MAG: type II secretion system protein, partial [Clostridia bacterium]|nr:type II secretion system protein [Clostridia bacterium]
MHKKNIKKAFTLAEALLTMVLLGIIAAFTITQIKPDNYGHQSMQALGKKMMANLAQATTQ